MLWIVEIGIPYKKGIRTDDISDKIIDSLCVWAKGTVESGRVGYTYRELKVRFETRENAEKFKKAVEEELTKAGFDLSKKGEDSPYVLLYESSDFRR